MGRSAGSGIGWVTELVEIAGGVGILADGAGQGAARDRVVTIHDGGRARAGSEDLYEIKSPLISQSGSAALTDGLVELQRIIERWAVRTRETSSMGATSRRCS
jgi:iron complex transport system substrate-binding protein